MVEFDYIKELIRTDNDKKVFAIISGRIKRRQIREQKILQKEKEDKEIMDGLKNRLNRLKNKVKLIE